MRVLDSHLHLWDPSRLDYEWLEGPLARRYSSEELSHADIGDDGASAAVFIQAESVSAQFLDEVRWVAENAQETGVRGIVAGAHLDRGEQTLAHLDALKRFEAVVGARHLLQDSPAGTALTEAFLAGARALAEHGLRFDACVRAHQLPEILALADAVPELWMTVDHLGKPPTGTPRAPLAPDPGWLRAISALADRPRITIKLSGLPAETGGAWTAAQVAPFLDAAADAFGPDRLIWGSDWPVSAIRDGGYRPESRAAWMRTVADWAADRHFDVDAVLWRNAAEFYGIA